MIFRTPPTTKEFIRELYGDKPAFEPLQLPGSGNSNSGRWTDRIRAENGKESALKQVPYGSREKDELQTDLDGLKFLGLISNMAGSLVLYKDKYELTQDGIRVVESISSRRLIQLRAPEHLRNLMFVACASRRKDVDLLYERCLIRAANSVGLRPFRIDISEPSSTITEAVLSKIKESALLIVDLTYARQSVYFEAGFAQGLGIPMVFTCRRDHQNHTSSMKKVHFDVKHFKISYWSLSSKGKFKWDRRMSPVSRVNQLVGTSN